MHKRKAFQQSVIICGSYNPIEEKNKLLELKEFVISLGFKNTNLIDELQNTSKLDALQISKFCLENGDKIILVFTRNGKKFGVIRELAHIAESPTMKNRVHRCTIFDEITVLKNNNKFEIHSSIPPLSRADVKNGKIKRRIFLNYKQFKEQVKADLRI